MNNYADGATLCVNFLFLSRKVGYLSGKCNRWLCRMDFSSVLGACFWGYEGMVCTEIGAFS